LGTSTKDILYVRELNTENFIGASELMKLLLCIGVAEGDADDYDTKQICSVCEM